MSPLTQTQDNRHMLGIYSSPQRKIEEGLEYLRIGFEEKNEAILMITDELTKDEIRNEIIKKWNIPQDYLTYLEKNAIINIKNSKKFYFSRNLIDRDRIAKQYSDLAFKSLEKGKRGLRTFGDMKIFFEIGYEKYVIEFEKSFQPLNDFPMAGICAYDLDDFVKLDRESRKILFDHHTLHFTNNIFENIFDESSSLIGLHHHICMYYESQSSSPFDPIANNSLLRYISEGLQRDHICIYLSMNNLETDHPKKILSRIPNLKMNQEKNFMIIENSDDYYINAACDDLKPFENLKKLIFEKVILANKKSIRIVCDIQDFLFRNKHFDQCVALEEWWDQAIEVLNKRHGLNVSLLCIFSNNNFKKTPFKYHRYRINDNHSVICDVDGIILSKNSKLDLLPDRSEKNMKRGER